MNAPTFLKKIQDGSLYRTRRSLVDTAQGLYQALLNELERAKQQVSL